MRNIESPTALVYNEHCRGLDLYMKVINYGQR